MMWVWQRCLGGDVGSVNMFSVNMGSVECDVVLRRFSEGDDVVVHRC